MIKILFFRLCFVVAAGLMFLPLSVVFCQDYGSTIIFREDYDSNKCSYYFFPKRAGPKYFGEFYFSRDRRLRADQNGQKGLIDLGVAAPFDPGLIDVPSDDKYKSDLPASVGHIYLTPARIGEIDRYILFRINGPSSLDTNSISSAHYDNGVLTAHLSGSAPAALPRPNIFRFGSLGDLPREKFIIKAQEIFPQQALGLEYFLWETGTINVHRVQADIVCRFTLQGPHNFKVKDTLNYQGSWTKERVPVGNYTIMCDPVAGYETPPSETKYLDRGERLVFDVRFRPSGNIVSQGEGTVNVQSNVKCRFTLQGPVSINISDTTYNQGYWTKPHLPSGSYTIMYDNVLDYESPKSETKNLSNGGSIVFDASYTPVPIVKQGAIYVQSNKRCSFTIQGNGLEIKGATDSHGRWEQKNVSPGTYTIIYGAIPRHDIPKDETQELKSGENISFQADYVSWWKKFWYFIIGGGLLALIGLIRGIIELFKLIKSLKEKKSKDQSERKKS